MRVSTPAEMTTIDTILMCKIISFFEFELHSQEKNLEEYKIHITIPDKLKDVVTSDIFKEINKMYICTGWSSKSKITYNADNYDAFLELYK